MSSILIAARPKLQKWISDAETDDPESLGNHLCIPSLAVFLLKLFFCFEKDTFLQINDQINTVLTRYEAFKKGDFSTARNPIPSETGSSSGGGGISLIDLDDGESLNTDPGISLGNSAPANDLSGLFLAGSSSSSQQPFRPGVMGMSMGMQHQHQVTSNTSLQQAPSQQTQPQTFSPTPVFANGGFSGSSMAALQQLSQTQTSTPPASIMLPSTPGSQRGTPIPAPQSLNYSGKAPQPVFGGAGFGGNPPIGGTFGGVTGAGFSSQQQSRSFVPLQPQTQAQQLPVSSTSNVASTQQSKDPFADLAGLF